MFNRFISKGLRAAKPLLLASPFKSSTILFTPNRFKTYLAHQQPFKPHTQEFLKLQLSAMQECFKSGGGSYSIEHLEKGKEFAGLTVGIDLIYGGLPLYEKNTLLSANEIKEISATMKKLGGSWMTYLINEDIDCIVHTTASGEKRYFVHNYFLDEKKEPTPSLTM